MQAAEEFNAHLNTLILKEDTTYNPGLVLVSLCDCDKEQL